MKLLEVEQSLQNMASVNNVKLGYQYWYRMLLNKCINIFNYENLPIKLPQHELELRLLLYGFSGIFNDEKYGIVTCQGTLSGVSIYTDEFPFFTYANPILKSKTMKIDEDCIIIKNSSLYQNLGDMIRRYARMLADVESSINIYTVNTRVTSWSVAENQQVAESLKNAYNKMRLGNMDIVTDTPIINGFHTVDIAKDSNQTLTELIMCRENLLRSFFREIGVKFAIDKKERMITDEVTAENQLLTINLSDMLKCRKDGIKKVNEMFGTNIKVDISEEFKQDIERVNTSESGVEKNGNSE